MLHSANTEINKAKGLPSWSVQSSVGDKQERDKLIDSMVVRSAVKKRKSESRAENDTECDLR